MVEDPRISAALIAAFGVFISALVAVVISRWQRAHTFNEHLYKKRLEVYPLLYRALGGLGKNLGSAALTRAEFARTLEEIDSWDNENAIYVSPSMIALLISLRHVLAEVADAGSPFESPTNDERTKFYYAALSLEKAAKLELGVYSLNDYHNAPLQKVRPHPWRSPQR